MKAEGCEGWNSNFLNEQKYSIQKEIVNIQNNKQQYSKAYLQYLAKKKSRNRNSITTLLLDYQDSNLEKQDQNLLCYHYTIVQTLNRTTRSIFDAAKIRLFIHPPNIFLFFFALKYFLHIRKAIKHPIQSFTH